MLSPVMLKNKPKNILGVTNIYDYVVHNMYQCVYVKKFKYLLFHYVNKLYKYNICETKLLNML